MKEQEMNQEILIKHLPLVKMIASRFFSHLPKEVEFDDLVGYGILGLVEASRDFDPARHVKFSTYAFYRIRGAILDALRAQDWLPRSLRDKIHHVESSRNELRNSLGRDPSEEELASHLRMSVEDVRSIQFKALQAQVISLEEELQHTVALIDRIAGTDTVHGAGEKELMNLLTEAIKSLDDKERLVITLYYYEGMNLKEIGTIAGLTESRISQILSNAVKMLRERMSHIKDEVVGQ